MTSPATDDMKARAKAWFETLRDDICAAFETLENLRSDVVRLAMIGEPP